MVKTIDAQLPVDIFDVQTNIPLIHQVVVAQLAAARQGTHSTKSRGEVSGGGKKPYRQKGTGRARQGSIRAPQYNGGGIVHGPTPRSYDQRTPKKMKAAALRGALSDRARTGRLHVVDSIVGGDKPSTKLAIATLLELTPRPRVLIVVDRDDTITALSLRNHDSAAILTFDQLNTYDVLKADDIVFTQNAFDAFVAARSAEGSETVALSALATEVSANDKAPAAKKAPAKKAPAKKAAAAEVVETPAAETDEAPAAKADKPAGATATQPYGPGSKAPLKSGNAPKGHEVKGNEDSMKYHEPDTQWYDSTVAEVWFDSAETAEAAGFTKAGDA
ncbi:50S ribosomal protein L4 [Aeromicrobium endophyticum]|uniref:Large ribosomal subunit protein uL4 n=1 Tax=Aeromicrobium endophyticum TaxID=2292704 RepID=A0A371P8Y0_9ACTN|nr:50S ribosomal protein L4 [Aeromicrobium endophyticum]REK72397.1 50S ribosomal protein L4 [Aeromicrobium endophyticum]